MRSAAVLLLISSAPLSLAATIGAADLFATSGRQLQSDGCEDDCSACCPCDGTPCGEECRDRDMCLENSQGCYESLCTSSGNDCCVGEGEALTCSNGFVPQIIGEGCFFNMGRTYTCCPPGVTLTSGNGGGSGITEKDPDYESDPGYDSSTSVTFALTASGSVTDYDEGKQALMRSDIARAASVAVDSVFLSITSASVRIAVEIVVGTLTDGMAVEGVLTTLLSDPASASAVFTSVTVPVESIAARPSATSTAQAGTCSPAYCTSPTDESSPFPNDCWAGTAFEACTCSRGEAQTTGLTLEYDGDTYHQYTCCDQGGSGEASTGLRSKPCRPPPLQSPVARATVWRFPVPTGLWRLYRPLVLDRLWSRRVLDHRQHRCLHLLLLQARMLQQLLRWCFPSADPSTAWLARRDAARDAARDADVEHRTANRSSAARRRRRSSHGHRLG